MSVVRINVLEVPPERAEVLEQHFADRPAATGAELHSFEVVLEATGGD